MNSFKENISTRISPKLHLSFSFIGSVSVMENLTHGKAGNPFSHLQGLFPLCELVPSTLTCFPPMNGAATKGRSGSYFFKAQRLNMGIANARHKYHQRPPTPRQARPINPALTWTSKSFPQHKFRQTVGGPSEANDSRLRSWLHGLLLDLYVVTVVCFSHEMSYLPW